ncbi:hypothetical protein AWR27_03450 [Spirosoma montaniterrae]|uniref:Uncharacterized protein n=1 Tax=Spirosoma montaniterrae TaxID=1178516 RepID=A0A1P9WSU8_9BACT|nr:hypothetical protein AWR27_03450 [Spirosoma montaniterrae]
MVKRLVWRLSLWVCLLLSLPATVQNLSVSLPINGAVFQQNAQKHLFIFHMNIFVYICIKKK